MNKIDGTQQGKFKMIISLRNTIVLIAAVGIVVGCQMFTKDKFNGLVDQSGQIKMPKNFRADMSHLGSWYVPAGEASGFHDVYASADAIDAYKKTGAFPDGAVLVKELRPDAKGHFTTGANVSYSLGEVKQWFVMVKDSKGRFPNNPIWGDGWGWALFKPDDPSVNLAKDYKKDCLGCHVPAKQTDWIYTQAYPTLN